MKEGTMQVHFTNVQDRRRMSYVSGNYRPRFRSWRGSGQGGLVGSQPVGCQITGRRRIRALPFPRMVPHSDGSGMIDRVGADVPRTRVGERVWMWNAAWMRPFGTAAQYVVLPSNQAVPLPENTDLAVGACLGIPALTAYHAVTVDGGVEGKTILVAGGAGAVGHFAIQLAKVKGAKQIIATVSGRRKPPWLVRRERTSS